MSDIFLHYASSDRPRAERLAEAFQARGWSVWWSRPLPVGYLFIKVNEQELQGAKCVVVLWSEHSIHSERVRAEAAEAQRRRVLIPVLLEDVIPPMEFSPLQTVSLVGWQRGEPHAGFDRLAAKIERVLGASRGEKAPEKPGRQSTTVRAEAPTGGERGRGPRWRTWTGRGVRIVALVAGFFTLLFGAWELARWGLDELNASAMVMPNSALCDAVPGFGPEMILVEGGKIEMQAEAGSVGRRQQTVPIATVKTFAIGTCEVTFEDYDRFAEATKRSLPDDEGWGRGRRPVINVSWDDAKAYAAWLSQQTGKSYRLPTEAEWEYAARSGGRNETWAGTSDEKQLPDYAVYDIDRTEPVGSKKANALGLYDMSGNVWEWVGDCYGEPTKESACGRRVLRGGSWTDRPVYLRVSTRTGGTAGNRDGDIGFRLVQDNSK